MTDAELLTQVKLRLGITGAYQDGLLSGYIDDVKAFLTDAGVPTQVINSNASIGVIARGVADTWNYGSGDGEFSKMFFQRAAQLVHSDASGTDEFEELVERVDDIENFMNDKTFLITE